MENAFLLPETEFLADKNYLSKMKVVFVSREKDDENIFIDHLISEGGETFFHYLNGIGHAYKSNMMLLSSRRNYSYGMSELQGSAMVINLRRLNRVPHMKSFLNTISKAVVPGTCFAGCFSEYRSAGSSFNSNSLQEINREEMVSLLESIGFSLVDMTEIKGLTYFLAKKN